MELTVNGQPQSCVFENVRELLTSMDIVPDTVVVELNGKILPSTDFAITKLKEGDNLEIVQFVAGG